MARYRELTLDVPAGHAEALYERLQRLAQRHRGPRADVRAWLLTMLEALAEAMEAELLKQDARGRLVVPAAMFPRPLLGPYVLGPEAAGPLIVER